MTHKITFNEAKQRFVEYNKVDVEIIETGYTGWCNKCKFYDLIEKDYFTSTPENVIRYNSGHPNRGKKKLSELNSLSFDKAKQRFIDQGREDIELCEDEYKSWAQKAKFFDKIENDYFYSVPRAVYKRKSVHPNRRKEKRVETNIKKFGFKSPAENTLIKEKMKQTNIERFGGSSPMFSDLVKNKIKETIIEKYGVSHQMKNELVKQKMKNTIKKLYGVDNINELTSKKIVDTGRQLSDWYRETTELKPSYLTIVRSFKNKEITLKDLEEILKNYKSNKSSLEVLVEKLLNLEHYNKIPKEIQKNYRPDFKLSETMYLNADGLYWHSEKQKDKDYHFEMRKEFEKNGLRIFQFYDNEIRDKSQIVKSIVHNNLGLIKNKIWARKTTIKEVSHNEASKFLDENHLMGSTNAKHLGLYHNEQLVSLLSYKEKKNICKIERFCSLIEYNIVGGFSKLLNHLESNLLKPSTTEIHNWVDLRYGTGNHLTSKGFKLIKETKGWKWTDAENVFNRLRCRANMDHRMLTENQHAEELNWYKIYDAGQRLFVKSI